MTRSTRNLNLIVLGVVVFTLCGGVWLYYRYEVAFATARPRSIRVIVNLTNRSRVETEISRAGSREEIALRIRDAIVVGFVGVTRDPATETLGNFQIRSIATEIVTTWSPLKWDLADGLVFVDLREVSYVGYFVWVAVDETGAFYEWGPRRARGAPDRFATLNEMAAAYAKLWLDDPEFIAPPGKSQP